MAKVKNIQTLTIEEKLEQAFVPKSEQPYTIPKIGCGPNLVA